MSSLEQKAGGMGLTISLFCVIVVISAKLRKRARGAIRDVHNE